MSKTIRTPLLNGLLQSDLDGGQHNLLNIGGIDVLQSKTAIVDLNAASDALGKVGSEMPFKTLGAALAAINVDQHLHPDNQSGYLLVIRPGTYTLDGQQTLAIQNLRVMAYGATIQCATNEETKLLISGTGISIEGLTIAGAVDTTTLPPGYDGADVLHGLIEVNGGANLALRECTLKNAAASGLYAAQGYDGLEVTDCAFTDSQIGVQCRATGGNNVFNVTFRGNTIQRLRRAGFKCVGSGNTTTRTGLVNLLLDGNIIQSCDSAGNFECNLAIQDFAQDVKLQGNRCTLGSVGIVVKQVVRASVIGNLVSQMSVVDLSFNGCQQVNASANNIDVRFGSGNAPDGIIIGGNYLIDNDSGPYIVAGNNVFGVQTGNNSIQINNSNRVLVVGNQFDGSVVSSDTVSLQFIGNVIRLLVASATGIYILSDARDITGTVISGNRFQVTSPGLPQLIELNSSFGGSIQTVAISANTCTEDRVYTNGIVHTDGVPPVVHAIGNLPKSTIRAGATYDNTRGWVNDDMVRFESDELVIAAGSGYGLFVDGGSTKVVGARKTGWATATGTATRTSFATSTVTLSQLAERVKALIDDLHATAGHGLIGP